MSHTEAADEEDDEPLEVPTLEQFVDENSLRQQKMEDCVKARDSVDEGPEMLRYATTTELLQTGGVCLVMMVMRMMMMMINDDDGDDDDDDKDNNNRST